MNKFWSFFIRSGIIYLSIGAGLALIFIIAISRIYPSLSWRLLIVQSGSMEPAVGVGDLTLIKTKPEYQPGDVIAFRDDKNRRVTHRILEIDKAQQGMAFTTKGDANRTVDSQKVPISQVEGAVDVVIPYLGYMLAFAKTRKGMIILALIPAVLLMADEVIKIRALARGQHQRKRQVIKR